MNIQQQIEQMLANASAPTTPGTGLQKQQAVANASAQKKATLGGFDPYAATVGAQEGTGYASATQQERDFRDMSTTDLWRTYGDAAVFQRAGANSGVAADQQAARDWGQAAADTVSGVGLGAFNGLAGIGALATGIINRDAGNAMSQGIQSVNEVVMENQSPALQARRRLNQAMDANDQRDSTQQYEQDLDAGKSGFMAGASRAARDFGSSIANAAADPMTLMDGTAQALGSFATVGPMSRVAGAINSKGILAARRVGLIGKDEARMLAKFADGNGTAALIGGMESGGVFQQTANEVLGMDFAALQKNSPEFNKLVEDGLSMEEARATLAHTAGLKAAAYTFPAAFVMGKFVANFERAPMTTASMKSGLANIGTQALEEAGQGGVGQTATNNAIQSTADKNRTLSEGVGAQMGTGALFGGLMAGGMQAPGMAAMAARKAVSKAAQGLRKAPAQDVEPAVTDPTVPARVSALVPVTTDLTQTVQAADQITALREQATLELSEAIQNNPTLTPEEKEQKLTDLEQLENAFAFPEGVREVVATSPTFPEEMKQAIGNARNVVEAFSYVSDYALKMAANGPESVQHIVDMAVALDQLEATIQGVIDKGGSVITADYPDGTPGGEFVTGMNQALENTRNSRTLSETRNTVRAMLQKAPALSQVNLDNVGEALARARYAPETLSEEAVASTLALADQGAITLSEAQRAYLSGSQALAAAMKVGGNPNINKVTNQVAFAEGATDSFKYPSLATHVSTITKAVSEGKTDLAVDEMGQLRNFAETMINKAAAINESAGTTNKVKYSNWIPSQSAWALSENGLNADLKGEQSRDFLMRINTEAATATAAYQSMAAQFPDLVTGVKPLPKLPELPAALSSNAATPATPTPPAASTPPTPAPTTTPPAKPKAQAVAPNNPVEKPVTSTSALKDLNAARTATNDPGQKNAVAKFADDTLRATLQQARALVQRTKSNHAEGLLAHARALQKERAGAKGQYPDQYLDELTSLAEAVEDYRQEFEKSTGDLFEEPKQVKKAETSVAEAKKPDVKKPSETPKTFKDAYDFTKETKVSAAPPTAITLNEGQKAAFTAVTKFLNSDDRAYSITGSAGTGKTTIVKELLKSPAMAQFEKVVMTSPTHRANAVTRANNPTGNVMTLHSLLGLQPNVDLDNFDAKKLNFDPKKLGSIQIEPNQLIIVDESSMINDSLFTALTTVVEQFPGTKLLFLGDSAQLPPVNQAHKSKALDSTSGQANLTEVMRAKNAALLDESIAIRKEGDFTKAGNMTEGNGVLFLSSRKNFMQVAIDMFTSKQFAKNPLLGRIVAYRNATVAQYNRAIRAQLFPGNVTIARGDLLMGYGTIGKPDPVTKVPTVANGMDYVVKTAADVKLEPVYIGESRIELPVINITIQDTLNINGTKTIKVISPTATVAQKNALAGAVNTLLNQARKDKKLWRSYYEFRDSYAVMENITDPQKGNVLLAKSLDYGYAHTIHKSQGGTYNYVLVDDLDVSSSRNAQEHAPLRYVGTTRAQQGAFILTDGEITNILGASTESTQQQDPVDGLPPPPQEAAEEGESSTPEDVDDSAPVVLEVKPEALEGSVLSSELDRLLPGVDNTPNVLASSYTAGNAPTLLVGLTDPITEIVQAVSSPKVFSELTDKRITEDDRKALQKFLTHGKSSVVQLLRDVYNRVGEHLYKKSNATDTVSDWILKGATGQVTDPAQRAGMVQLKREGAGAYTAWLDRNVGEDGTEYVAPNEKLVTTAVIAAGQWFLSAGNSGLKKLTESQIASLVPGLSADMVRDDLQRIASQGMSYVEAVSGIKDHILKAWNLRLRDDAPIARADAVINSMASQIFTSMVHGGGRGHGTLTNAFFDRVDIVVSTQTGEVLDVRKNDLRDSHGKASKKTSGDGYATITRYVPKHPEKSGRIANALTSLLGIPDPDTLYFDPSEIEVSETQQRSFVPLSGPEQEAQRRQQSTGFTLNTPFMDVYSALSNDNILALFGEPIEATMNESTRMSAEGKNTTVLGGANQVRKVKDLISLRAEQEGKSPEEVAVYYRFESISTGRSMMIGRYNPQSDKGMRQAVTSMKSQADLTNPDQKTLWDSAALQMTGVKIYAMKPEDISPMADALFAEPEMVAAIDALQEVLETKTASSNLVPLLQAAAAKTEDGMTNELLHVLIDRARYNMADEAGRKKFESRLYIEADGVANGPAGAVAMLSMPESISEMQEFIARMAKVGVFMGNPNQTMNQHRTSGEEGANVDTYAAAGVATSEVAALRIKGYQEQLQNTELSDTERKNLQQFADHHRKVLDLMSLLMPASSFQIEESAEVGGDIQLKISRKVSKNPVTITVYGSGMRGIAGNLVDAMLKELTNNISKAAKDKVSIETMYGGLDNYRRITELLEELSHTFPYYDKQSETMRIGQATDIPNTTGMLKSGKGLQKFRMNPAERTNLISNLTEFFVSDLNQGIDRAMGQSVLSNSQLLVMASNAQSVMAIHAYHTELDALIAAKKKDNPKWDYVSHGLTKKDLKSLRKKLEGVAPYLRTAVQAWNVATSTKSDAGMFAGADVEGTFKVPHTQQTPAMSGVRVVPYLIIGSGDAAMVTKLMNDLDLPSGSMQVYDGINLPFMASREGGRVANKSIVEAWLENNPLAVLADSLEASANSYDYDAALARLEEVDPFTYSRMAEQPHPSVLLEMLRQGAAKIDALHTAMRKAGFASDQMAAIGATHVSPGSSTPDTVVADMWDEYTKELGNVSSAQVSDSTIAEQGSFVISGKSLKDLANMRGIDPTNRQIIRGVLTNHADRLRNLSIVRVTAESDLSSYFDSTQEAAAHKAELLSGAVKGMWLESAQALLLGVKSTMTTLAHELTHAASYAIIREHYLVGLPKNELGKAIGTSLRGVFDLLKQFYESAGKGVTLSPEAAKVLGNFRLTIQKDLATESTQPGDSFDVMWSKASAEQRAKVIAEFIAHGTTDKVLRSIAKASLVSRIKTAVVNFLRSVVFGTTKGDPVGDNILEQLEFHSQIIMAGQAKSGPYRARAGARNLNQVALNTADMDAATVIDAFDKRVGAYLESSPTALASVSRLTDIESGALVAARLQTHATSVGFLKTPVQREAFSLVAAVMSAQASISPAFSQASYAMYSQALDALEGKLTPAQQDLLRGRGQYKEMDAHGRTTLVPMFVALGMIDPEFKSKLATIAKAEPGKIEGNFDEKIQQLGNRALSMTQDILTGSTSSKNVAEQLAKLVGAVQKQSHIENSLATQVEQMTIGALGKANDWVSTTLADKSKAVAAKAAKVSSSTKSKTLKAAASAAGIAANVFSDAGVQANAAAMLTMVNKGKSDFLRGIVKDLTGRVESNAQVYDLIKQVGQAVSKARQFYREKLPSVLAKNLTKMPSPETRTLMFNAIARTGLSALVQDGNFGDALTMAFDDSKRAAEIARIEGELRNQTPRTEGRIRKKAKLLAEYMTTGVVQAGLLRNADAVANLLDDKVSGLTAPGVAEQSKDVVDLVDQLITLYAVDVLPQNQRKQMAELLETEAEGVQQVLGVLTTQTRADKERHTGAARFNAWKGYIPSDGAAGGSLVVRDVREEKNLLRQGYRKVADYKGTSLFRTVNMAYYYTPVGKAPFNQGIIQNARMTAGGVDQSTGFAVGFPTAGRITQKTTVDRLARNAHLDSSREALLAVYDEKGNVVAFERSIDPDQLERLQPSTDVLAMLGQWMGRQVEEEMAQAVNHDAVTKVHDMWAKSSKSQQGEFVNVLDTSKLDPVIRDAVRLIPNDVKAQAQRLFGTGRFMVRRDMLEDVFGYRDASIGDAWTGNSRWSPKTQERVRKLAEMYLGDDAFRLLVQGEERWKNLVKDAKTLIVVKSVIVPAANFVANIFQMLARGVPMSTIARGLRDKTLEVDFYVKTHVEHMDLAVQLMALGSKDTNQRQKLEARIQAIEDSWKRLSIWPLLAAGEFGSITDAGISRDEILLSEGKLQAYIESKTEKLPPGLQRAGKWALITKDTALFQGLQKSMEYGDFLAKAIMYEHRLAKGKSKAEALGEITDEFVNYDRHPGRIRGYVEDLGLAWFYNYKLRIAKTAFSMLRKDPLRVALLAGMGLPGMELPVTENVFTKAIEGTLGHSIGPGMLFSAPELNPWVAAMQ